MQVLADAGFSPEQLQRLNRVRIHQQVLFLSDILTASGRLIERDALDRRPGGSRWSRLSFPGQHPPEEDFDFWKVAVLSLHPIRGLGVIIGPYTSEGHRIWNWRLDEVHDRLLRRTHEGTVEIFDPTNRPNRWQCSSAGTETPLEGMLCSVATLPDNTVRITGSTAPGVPPAAPSSLLQALDEGGDEWMWTNLEVTGEDDWLVDAISDGSCYAVTDGSYIEDEYPDICSAAFIFECQNGRGRIVGSFVERSEDACAYRGELMGLMAIHLILRHVNAISPGLSGQIHLFSDCLGALDMVEHIPTPRIPSRCKHADILKNILINCQGLGFDCSFSHVKAHQDDTIPFHQLDRPSQLNCMMDEMAKRAICSLHPDRLPRLRPFPMEPLVVSVGGSKITTDSGSRIRFWAHRQLARPIFTKRGILDPRAFDKVNWEPFYTAMHRVPRLFQAWACKQITNIAATNRFRAKFTDGLSPLCPSCLAAEETCTHILDCPEVGRVDNLMRGIALLDAWLEQECTEPALHACLVWYARSRGTASLHDFVRGWSPALRLFGKAQDLIGWRRFMEGMVACGGMEIQAEFMRMNGIRGNAQSWAIGLTIKLLECTHGQWIYRNIIIHDNECGTARSAQKEQILKDIEAQLSNEDTLSPEDQYLLEINLDDMGSGTGESQEYWLLAVQAARRAKLLREATPEGIG